MNSSRVYELRQFDEPLLEFSAMNDDLGRLVVSDGIADEPHQHLLPAMLLHDHSSYNIREWLSSRVIPKHRAFADRILEQYGLIPGDTLGIIDLCRALSVTDSYWVVPQGFSGTWAEYNLFENKLDEMLSLVAYTGYTSSQRRAAGLSSEWTTDGTYPKCWRQIDNQLTLYKAGNPLNENAANKDYSPYSEYLAAQIATVFGLEHVTYGLEVWKGKLAATCPAFTTQGISSVQLYHLAGKGKLPDNLSIITEAARMTGQRELLDSFLDIIFFDAVIANPDRHSGNIAFLRDNNSGLLLGYAPIYDNNLSLFPTDMATDYEAWPARAGALYPSGSDIVFDRLIAQFMQPRHHEWARRLLDFEFKNTAAEPMPDQRIRALGAYINARARQILSIPIVPESALLPNLERVTSTRTVDSETAPLISCIDMLLGHSMEVPQSLHDSRCFSGNIQDACDIRDERHAKHCLDPGAQFAEGAISSQQEQSSESGLRL